MRGHLPSARGRVILRAYGLQQHFQRRDTHHQAKRAVAVIRIQPIDSGTQKQPHGGGHAFMAGAGDLEVNFVLALKLNLAIVKPAREEHGAVQLDQRVAIEATKLGCIQLGHFDARLYRHSECLAVLEWRSYTRGKLIIPKSPMAPPGNAVGSLSAIALQEANSACKAPGIDLFQ